MTIAIQAIGDFASEPVDGVAFHSLAKPSLAVPSAPRFIFGPCPAAVSDHYYRLFGLSSVGVFKARRVTLSGDFLIGRNETYFRSPELNIHEPHISAEVARLAAKGRRLEAVSLPGSYVVLAGPGNRVYGHWLIEYLPKLGLLQMAGYNPREMRYLLPSSAPSYVQKWLHLLGIGPEQLTRYDADGDVVAADELIIPTVMHNGARASPLLRDAVRFMLEQISAVNDLRGSAFGPRLYFSRGEVHQGRALSNRQAIEDLAVAAGFEVVMPEKLALIDQIRLFAGARQVLGEYGSALHGSIFSPPGTVVCALRGTSIHPGFIQSGLGDVLDQPTGYVFGETEGGEHQFSFRVEPEAFRSCLAVIFGGTALKT